MKYCNSCQIKYNTPLKKCVFCNNELSILDSTDMYYNYPIFIKEKKTSYLFMKIFSFLLVLANIICLFVDLKTASKPRINWSLYILSASIYSTLLLWNFLRYGDKIKKIISFFLVSIIFLISIGTINGNYHWAIDYILPFGIITSTLLMTFSLFGKRNKLYDFSVYVIISACLSIVPLFFYLANVTITDWPTLACFLYCFVTIAALFVFRPKDTMNELKRRLHL